MSKFKVEVKIHTIVEIEAETKEAAREQVKAYADQPYVLGIEWKFRDAEEEE